MEKRAARKTRVKPPARAPRPLPAKEPKHEDSDDIERAVYDGMQDLRVKKPA